MTPSILGLYGLSGAAFLLSADTAHWFGGGHKTLLLAPFAALFAYEAGHVLGAAADRRWGAFWIANTVLAWMLSTGGGQSPAVAWAFLVVAAATFACLAAARAESKALVTVLASLAAGSAVSGIALLAGTGCLLAIAEYPFATAALAACYTATALALGRRAHAREMPAVNMARREAGLIRDRAA
ncbi:MAG TPA: hypothetical protein VN893_04160 [Bryobacteraceae bacterium]|nr:hypothetical protein [Bryobacteraceae bacterium]